MLRKLDRKTSGISIGILLLSTAAMAQPEDSRDSRYRGHDQLDLYVREVATGVEKRVTSTVMVENVPDWSPDGRQIVYMGSHAGVERYSDIYVVDIEGSTPRNLTQTPDQHEGGPSWSPDGREIAYSVMGEDKTDIRIDAMTLSTGATRRLTHTAGAHLGPDWSPDGRSVVFEHDLNGAAEIAVLDLATGIERQLTHLKKEAKFASGPDWSPDSARVVFAVKDGYYARDLYIVDTFGGEPVKIVNTSAGSAFPAWSPSGSKIAFARLLGEGTRIAIMGVDGSNVTTLSAENNAYETSPAWSPDGTQLLYFSRRIDLHARSVPGLLVFEDGREVSLMELNDLPPISFVIKDEGGHRRYEALTDEEYLEFKNADRATQKRLVSAWKTRADRRESN